METKRVSMVCTVLEAAKKNLNETGEGRFGETKTLLDDEQNKGKKYTVRNTFSWGLFFIRIS